jgi:hypothetical protein
MKLKLLLIIAAIYMALVGLGHLVSPISMSAGALPADASAGVAAFLRHYAPLFIAIAAMNLLARDSAPSTALNAIVLANTIVFGFGAILDVLAVIGGAGATGLVPATINLGFAIAFLWAGRALISPKTS